MFHSLRTRPMPHASPMPWRPRWLPTWLCTCLRRASAGANFAIRAFITLGYVPSSSCMPALNLQKHPCASAPLALTDLQAVRDPCLGLAGGSGCGKRFCGNWHGAGATPFCACRDNRADCSPPRPLWLARRMQCQPEPGGGTPSLWLLKSLSFCHPEHRFLAPRVPRTSHVHGE